MFSHSLFPLKTILVSSATNLCKFTHPFNLNCLVKIDSPLIAPTKESFGMHFKLSTEISPSAFNKNIFLFERLQLFVQTLSFELLLMDISAFEYNHKEMSTNLYNLLYMHQKFERPD